jgi:hypothetical protein
MASESPFALDLGNSTSCVREGTDGGGSVTSRCPPFLLVGGADVPFLGGKGRRE